MTQPKDLSPAALDLDALLNRTMGSAQIAQLVLKTFDDQLANAIQELRSLAAAGKTSELNRAVHAIKGAAANVGADQLRYAAAALEDCTAAGPAESLTHQLDSISLAIDSYRAARPAADARLATMPT